MLMQKSSDSAGKLPMQIVPTDRQTAEIWARLKCLTCGDTANSLTCCSLPPGDFDNLVTLLLPAQAPRDTEPSRRVPTREPGKRLGCGRGAESSGRKRACR